MENDAAHPSQEEQPSAMSPGDGMDPNAIAQPPGRAARDPGEGPGLSGGSAAAEGEDVAEEEIGGGD